MQELLNFPANLLMSCYNILSEIESIWEILTYNFNGL